MASVKTGDRVEVLEGDQNWTKVKLPNGTVGWVATRFLVDQVRTATTTDPKTQEELKEVKDQNLALSKQLEGYQQEREKLLKENEEGKKALQDLQQEKQGRVAPELNQLKARNDQLEKQINELKQQAASNSAERKKPVPQRTDFVVFVRFGRALCRAYPRLAGQPEEKEGFQVLLI